MWCVLIISTLMRLRSEGCELKASLGYLVISNLKNINIKTQHIKGAS
jgi:hypothetical protein